MNTKISFGNITLGFAVRRSIQKLWTYRVRRGNGFFGSNVGERYQDKYSYFVPTSITNTQSETYRVLYREAVSNWKSNLTEEEKREYNVRVQKGMHMSGYNLYIKEYILGLI
jgi:hypothetical protein